MKQTQKIGSHLNVTAYVYQGGVSIIIMKTIAQ